MPNDLAVQLQQTIDHELPQLKALTSEQSAAKPAGLESWSPRQELGHLIDSASNNHIRFVRAGTEPEFHGPGYAQNAWVDIHAYQETTWSSIVDFWYQYNCFLAGLLKHIPDDKLTTVCHIGHTVPATLGFVIEDYILHMQHHLDHLLNRPIITDYPSGKAKTP